MVPSLWQEFIRFIWWMQTERRVAANPQTKPTDLGCESIRRHHRHLLLLLLYNVMMWSLLINIEHGTLQCKLVFGRGLQKHRTVPPYGCYDSGTRLHFSLPRTNLHRLCAWTWISAVSCLWCIEFMDSIDSSGVRWICRRGAAVAGPTSQCQCCRQGNTGSSCLFDSDQWLK